MNGQNTDDRVSGFVIAGDGRRGKSVLWKVRVKDKNSQYDGRRFAVASVHGDIALARGLNVTFLVGSVDGPNGQKVLRAVDVRLQ